MLNLLVIAFKSNRPEIVKYTLKYSYVKNSVYPSIFILLYISYTRNPNIEINPTITEDSITKQTYLCS